MTTGCTMLIPYCSILSIPIHPANRKEHRGMRTLPSRTWRCGCLIRDGTTTLEIEYERSADDNTANDVSYLPQLMRFKIVDYATYRAFLVLQQFTAAQMYRGEWEAGMVHTKKADGRKRWAAGGFRCHNWF